MLRVTVRVRVKIRVGVMVRVGVRVTLQQTPAPRALRKAPITMPCLGPTRLIMKVLKKIIGMYTAIYI
jgi:hypothetical protein